MKERFYSNGKLLITGEYLVLDGAKSLALPTIYGQDLCISTSNLDGISWKSFDTENQLWFETLLTYEEIIAGGILENREVRSMLINILHNAYLQNPKFVNDNKNLLIETHLDFDKSWGLGTSSTLINNIAQWTKTDAFRLLQTAFGGSGYDIAVAKAKGAIIYQTIDNQPSFRSVNFRPEFRKHLYFVYLNKKQNSHSTIKDYKKKAEVSRETILQINEITHRISTTEDFRVFCDILEQHERILAEVLEVPTIKQQLFPDFTATIKSLGGWGGDFILAAAKENPTSYFQSKGYKIVIPYSNLILE